jgi:adenine-specific DNA-methyltransferase
MARKSRKEEDIEAYRNEAEKRKNAVPVGLAYDTSKPKPNKYEYDPRLDLQLVWSGEKEHTSFEIPTVSLHTKELYVVFPISYPERLNIGNLD